jgi:hypothetical protein
MKLEVGKSYLTRVGQKVRIAGQDFHHEFPYDGSNEHSYTRDGYVWGSHRQHNDDLVAEWGPPSKEDEPHQVKVNNDLVDIPSKPEIKTLCDEFFMAALTGILSGAHDPFALAENLALAKRYADTAMAARSKSGA